MKFIFLLCLLPFFQFSHTTIALDNVSDNIMESLSARLSSTVKPDHYSINLHLNSTEIGRLFYGEINITIVVMVPINIIELHARQLKINGINLVFDNGSIIKSSNHIINSATDILSVTFLETIPIGKCILNFKYTGVINNDGGLIRGFYTESGNKSASFIATKLHEIGARQVFPCWDEPSFKANFTIIVKHDAHYTAISNMHVIKIERDEIDLGMQTTTFANTPKMSTYLVAIVVSNLIYHESNDKVIRLWSTNSTIDKIKYTMKIVQKIMNKLKNFTNIGYTDMGFETLDIVVLPNFLGITRSWGLITVLEDIIAIEDGIVDSADRANAIKALSYACVCQWIGNLVTAVRWSDWWLYEGVINYLGFLISEQIMDFWRVMDQMIADIGFWRMRKIDSQSNADSIQTWTRKPRNSNLDDIALLIYKPVRIIHMASHVFGDVNLRTAWQNYLHDHAFQTSTFDDFINTLSAVIGGVKPIGEIFHNWITKPGFPIITVQRNYTAGTAIISQSRYLANQDNTRELNEKYWVPMNYAKQDSVDFENSTITHWLNPNDESIEINGLKDDNWIIFNKQSFGYYCVNYDIKNWNLIIGTMKSSNYTDIHIWNRIQLVTDAWELVQNNQLEFVTLLSMLGYLEHETELLPWIIILQRVIFAIEWKLFGTKYYTLFKEYLSKLPNKLIKKIGFDETRNDDHVTKLYRVTALSTSCEWNVSPCINEAAVRLYKWLNNPETNKIPTALRRIIFCYGIRGGNQKTWEAMWKIWVNEQNSEILNALGCTLNKTNINQLLSKTIDPNSDAVKVQMIFEAVKRGSKEGQDIALEYVMQNWKSIEPPSRRILFYRVTNMISEKDKSDKVCQLIHSITRKSHFKCSTKLV